MSIMARTDKSIIGRWWWTVDRWLLASMAIITAVGAVLTLAASPAVAVRIGYEPFYFAHRQFVFLPMALLVMLATSLLSHQGIRRLAVVCLAVSVMVMVATMFVGEEIKGATRWIRLGGFSLQPSEFVKPGLVVVAAWMFAERRLDERFPGYALSGGLFALVAVLLIMQPDVGMTIIVSAVWGMQFFLAGLPLILVMAIAMLFIGGGVGAYFTFSHVRDRVDRFLDPSGEESYQVTRSLEAFRNGGMFGRGPGEGQVKSVLPDAHADFILAVAGEEFGLIVCLLVVALFAFVVLRGFNRLLKENDLFALLAGSGLLAQFGFQAIINMASTIHLIPPKGMTLPFISYGGSSMLAMAYAMGMVLALTRERPGQGDIR